MEFYYHLGVHHDRFFVSTPSSSIFPAGTKYVMGRDESGIWVILWESGAYRVNPTYWRIFEEAVRNGTYREREWPSEWNREAPTKAPD